MDGQLVREKIAQAKAILEELDIDLWMLIGRETAERPDPSFPLVVGTSVTWTSLFLISRSGEQLAIAGTGDTANIAMGGAWTETVGYVQSFREPLLAALDRFAPRQIASRRARSPSTTRPTTIPPTVSRTASSCSCRRRWRGRPMPGSSSPPSRS